MLRDASWIVSAFLILTFAFAGVCSRHIDKRNSRKRINAIERELNMKVDEQRKKMEANRKSFNTGGAREKTYRPPREYIYTP